ncbi:MAG: hypothetical protein ABIY52_01360, partial [Gemmatimonadaceae bacterium]
LAEGDVARAERLFDYGVELGTAHDAYGAAWLVATCAPLLAQLSPSARPRIMNVARDYARRAETMGSAPLSARFSALLGDVRLAASNDEGTPMQALVG